MWIKSIRILRNWFHLFHWDQQIMSVITESPFDFNLATISMAIITDLVIPWKPFCRNLFSYWDWLPKCLTFCLAKQESLQTYEYALAPIEVQTHYPKVIAEEHTIHELPAHSLTPHLTPNEPIILTDSSHNYRSTAKSLYGAQRMPKLLGPELSLYDDDPKEQSKGYLPEPLKPALPMHEFNQVKPDTSEEITFRAQPLLIAPSSGNPYARAPVKHIGLTGYSTNFNDHLESSLGNYAIDKPRVVPHMSSRSFNSYPYVDHIPGIPGKPWKDYPVFHSIPDTHFKCRPHNPGYFADMEAGCQVSDQWLLWHEIFNYLFVL